ncbi:peptidoglycan-binding protein [Minwuia sp. IMCC3009]|uniref:peptidoglycan-binding protein n=1 Tax=Minwuia sp. IMCC3009 TaxID=3040674 RepID=UPI002479ECC8|nr:peptidoglycan-binding protein [Minwuia sp. IMCC3009]
MSNAKFLIPTMLAAGLFPVSSAVLAGGSNHVSADKSLIDDIVQHAQSITDSNEFTLAGHQSHQSHQSHASHSSHRSYYAPEPPDPGPAAYQPSNSDYQTAALSGRNEASTPRSSVLPRSLSTAKKPKVLKGNTAKFAQIVTLAQLALQSRGYEPGAVGGDLNSRTIAAIYKFQRDSGLVPTGKLDNGTLNTLGVIAN